MDWATFGAYVAGAGTSIMTTLFTSTGVEYFKDRRQRRRDWETSQRQQAERIHNALSLVIRELAELTRLASTERLSDERAAEVLSTVAQQLYDVHSASTRIANLEIQASVRTLIHAEDWHNPVGPAAENLQRYIEEISKAQRVVGTELSKFK